MSTIHFDGAILAGYAAKAVERAGLPALKSAGQRPEPFRVGSRG